jgi:hypothetical protein
MKLFAPQGGGVPGTERFEAEQCAGLGAVRQSGLPAIPWKKASDTTTPGFCDGRKPDAVQTWERPDAIGGYIGARAKTI